MKYRPPLPAAYPWMSGLEPQDTRPSWSVHQAKIRTNLAYAHYQHGHFATNANGYTVIGLLRSQAMCPACFELSKFTLYWACFWKPRDVSRMFR